MGYLHINNLYKDQRIQEFKRVYCLEKIHGTSAHVRWKDQEVGFFSGGEKHERFIALFDHEVLYDKFMEQIGYQNMVVYGEAYGGKQQGMSGTYGEELKFIVFDIKIEGLWLSVLKADDLAKKLGFEFVAWEECPSDTDSLNAQRDLDSTQAVRNGMGEGKKREGVVIRPPFECTLNNGERLIVKHKRDDFRETKTPRVAGQKLEVLTEAADIADEWVTPGRLKNILSKFQEEEKTIENTGRIINLMLEDVEREAKGEIVLTKAVKKAVAASTAKLYKQVVTQIK